MSGSSLWPGMESVVFVLFVALFLTEPIDLPAAFRRPRGMIHQQQAFITDVLSSEMIVVDLATRKWRTIDLPGLQVYRAQSFEDRLVLPAMNRRRFYTLQGGEVAYLGNYANYGFLNYWIGPEKRICVGSQIGPAEQVMLFDGAPKLRLCPASPLYEKWRRRDGNFFLTIHKGRVYYLEPAAMDRLITFDLDGANLSEQKLRWPPETFGPDRERGENVVTIANGFKTDDGLWLTTQIRGYCLNSVFFGSEHSSPLTLVEGQVIGEHAQGLISIKDGGETYQIHFLQGETR